MDVEFSSVLLDWTPHCIQVYITIFCNTVYHNSQYHLYTRMSRSCDMEWRWNLYLQEQQPVGHPYTAGKYCQTVVYIWWFVIFSHKTKDVPRAKWEMYYHSECVSGGREICEVCPFLSVADTKPFVAIVKTNHTCMYVLCTTSQVAVLSVEHATYW